MNQIFRFRYWSLSLSIAALVYLLPFALKVQTDPSNQAMFERDSIYSLNEKFQADFGGDDTVVVGIESEDLFNTKKLNWLSEFSKIKTRYENIENSDSVFNYHPFSSTIPIELYKKDLLADSKLKNYLLNNDANFMAVIFKLKPNLSSELRQQAINNIEGWLGGNKQDDVNIYLSGTALEQDRFVTAIDHDHNVFVPLTFLLMVVMIFFVYRSWHYIIYPVVVILATLVSTQALMYFNHIEFNVMTSLISPIILIVSTSDAIHLQSYSLNFKVDTPALERFHEIYGELKLPCLMTSLTTAAGFFSLLINKIVAIQEFGFYAAVGVLLALFWTFVFLPSYLSLQAHWHDLIKSSNWDPFLNWLSGFMLKHRILILVSSGLMLVFGIFASFGMKTDTDILGSFKNNSQFKKDTNVIHEKLGGVYALELMIKIKDVKNLSVNDVDSLTKLITEIKTIEEVSHLRSFEDLPKFYPKEWLLNPVQIPAELKEAFGFSANANSLHINILTKLSSTSDLISLADKIMKLADRYLPESLSPSIVGNTYLLAKMSQKLAMNQIKSISLAMLIINVLLSIWFRSLRLGLLSLLVNLCPIVFAFGLLSFFGVTLNTATATIGSVSIGLIIDNAIHIIHRLKRSHHLTSLQDEINCVAKYCAHPVISSTVILIIGFSVTLLGSIKPTIYFGAMLIVILLSALFFNIMVLPLVLGKKEFVHAD